MEKLSWKWLRSRPAQVLTAVLVIQAVLFYNVSHGESIPLRQPLTAFPKQIASWTTVQEGVVDEKTNAVLRADDTLTRVYVDSGNQKMASLFIAYFQSQRQGQSPHSPKHCMPGAGWSPVLSEPISFKVPNRPDPISVNKFILQKGSEKTLVLYWYQANQRVIASEYSAKVYLVWDALRYNRTDTALVRVIVPLNESITEQAATEAGVSFIQSVFPNLGQYLPA